RDVALRHVHRDLRRRRTRLQRDRTKNNLRRLFEACRARRVSGWKVSRSLPHAAGECAGDGCGSLAGAVVCQSRLGPTDSYDLAGSVVDLSGVDAADGDCAALLIVLIACAL